jgi:hypothetical protein
MNEDERRPPQNPRSGELPVPGSVEQPAGRGSFGTAPPGGDDSFGTAPTTPGTTPVPNPPPRPAPTGGRNVAALLGLAVVVLAIVAAIVGFAIR